MSQEQEGAQWCLHLPSVVPLAWRPAYGPRRWRGDDTPPQHSKAHRVIATAVFIVLPLPTAWPHLIRATGPFAHSFLPLGSPVIDTHAEPENHAVSVETDHSVSRLCSRQNGLCMLLWFCCRADAHPQLRAEVYKVKCVVWVAYRRIINHMWVELFLFLLLLAVRILLLSSL